MSDFKNFKEECIKKGLERMGFDFLNREMENYEREKEDKPTALLPQEINFPPEAVEKLFSQCRPGFFWQIVVDPKRKRVNIQNWPLPAPAPYRLTHDC